MLKKLNIKHRYDQLGPNVATSSINNKDHKIIIITSNYKASNAERRYDIARELGNIFMSGNPFNASDKMVLYRGREETNYFARVLLMPMDLMLKEINAMEYSEEYVSNIISEKYISDLAWRFGVTPVVMAIRLTELGCA